MTRDFVAPWSKHITVKIGERFWKDWKDENFALFRNGLPKNVDEIFSLSIEDVHNYI